MSLGRWHAPLIYLYRDPVDMRKGMDGLALIVIEQMQLGVMDASLFVFINKGRDKIKLLLWENNGFWVLYKKLVKQRFKWPNWFESAHVQLSETELEQLLSGFDLNGLQPHKPVYLKHFA